MNEVGPSVRLRTAPGFAALLLAMLSLHALVPAGFMASVADGGVQMVFCESDSALSHGHAHQHPHSSTPDPSCPFAQSSGPAPLPALPALATDAYVHAFDPPIATARTGAPCGPVRQQTCRGPPALA